MKIKKIISQIRRDFEAIYVCERCAHEEYGRGYDDKYFHNTVIPEMKCKMCGKVADGNYIPRATKYLDGYVI